MSKLKTMYVSQRYNYSQFFDSLSTSDNTFHIYGICLNRNRKVYSLCNFAQSDSHNGNTITLPKW